LLSLRPDAKALESVSELQDIATSLFVAVFESLFVVRLRGIVRKPSTETEFQHNANLFLSGLKKMLPKGMVQIPPEITAESIVSGSIPSITYMIRFFLELQRLFSVADSSPSSRHPIHRHGGLSRSKRHGSVDKVHGKKRQSARTRSVQRKRGEIQTKHTEPDDGSDIWRSGNEASASAPESDASPRQPVEITGEAKDGSETEPEIGLTGVAAEAARAAVRRAQQEQCDARITAHQESEIKRRVEVRVCTVDFDVDFLYTLAIADGGRVEYQAAGSIAATCTFCVLVFV
jgi:hypothetical protein